MDIYPQIKFYITTEPCTITTQGSWGYDWLIQNGASKHPDPNKLDTAILPEGVVIKYRKIHVTERRDEVRVSFPLKYNKGRNRFGGYHTDCSISGIPTKVRELKDEEL